MQGPSAFQGYTGLYSTGYQINAQDTSRNCNGILSIKFKTLFQNDTTINHRLLHWTVFTYVYYNHVISKMNVHLEYGCCRFYYIDIFKMFLS